ncbi:MAG TPA: type I phosphomannose isomerase catalytic subunit [Terracidiphilus sp.]|jgi:mannose-6-phosphate isomerase
MAGDPNSTITELAPFLVEPRFVTRVWGFRDLRPWYDRVVDAGAEPVGEVWLTGDECRVATGNHVGMTLGALFEHSPNALLGAAAPGPQSPLLIKMIFAREKLSVQVHPDDRLAQKYGQPRGKTECWYSLYSEPGAQVAVGLKPGVTLDQVRTGIADSTLEHSLNVVPVSAGDMIFVDAGTVHAIWPGSIILETQQNCDITYRMYDYGRPRELHIEKSLEATRLETRAGKVPPRRLKDRTILVDVEYFRVERVPVEKLRPCKTLPAPDEAPAGLSFLFAAAGSARIHGPAFEPVELPARAIAVIPAASSEFAVENLGGLDLIRISPRWPAGAH